jgi:hypothetical protein
VTEPAFEECRAFFTRASRRLTVLAVARGVAAGLAVGAILLIILLPALPWRDSNALALVTAVIAIAIGATVALVRGASVRVQPARTIERLAPQCRNVLVTAEELMRSSLHPWHSEHATPSMVTSERRSPVAERASAYIEALVLGHAAHLCARLDLGELLPARRTALALGASVMLFAISSSRRTSPSLHVADALALAIPATIARVDDVTATIASPAYAALPTQSLQNPNRIDALQGSRITLRIHSNADSVAIQTLQGTRTLTPSARNEFSVSVPADLDGFVGIQPLATGRSADVRRLIALTVIPDAAPAVRISVPARDVHLKDTHATLTVAVEATDDIALASMTLRYTKVSGSGERFSFADGEVPLVVTRASARTWSARAVWSLEALALAPGDMVVYRAIASDRRPGAAPRESDSFIADIAAPGSEAIAGFSIDPDQERYAVSQQMVVLKTERLIAKRAQMLPDSALLASQELAAEQRKVRAEFVFMMGGEVADAPDPSASMTDLNEEAEAEGEADIAAGRMANQGRIALMKAIRFMSRAATLLTTAELSAALTSEKAAVVQLEQAFSRQRIILRALSEREQLDLARRLSGTLTDAHSERREPTVATESAMILGLRRALADVAAIARSHASPQRASTECTTLAESILRLDPSRRPVQAAAARMSDAAIAFAEEHDLLARAALDRTATMLSSLLRDQLPLSTEGDGAATASRALDAHRLSGAIGDALNRAAPSASSASSASSKPRE